MNHKKLILLLYIINYIESDVVKNCEISNYCGSETIACSIYGNCNFKLFDYYKVGSTEEDKKPHCECNMGYSSYDITNLKQDNKVLCCYKKRGLLTAFFLELFLGIGIGHFYLGNYYFALFKIIVQAFLCVTVFCVTYFVCTREHSLQSSYNDINNNENINKNVVNEKKNSLKENKNGNEIIDENENENDNDNESNEKKDNESRNQSFELEENKENEIMLKKFVSCPRSMLIIYLSGGACFLFYIVDICLIAFGFFKDGNGEELFMWN